MILAQFVLKHLKCGKRIYTGWNFACTGWCASHRQNHQKSLQNDIITFCVLSEIKLQSVKPRSEKSVFRLCKF